MEVAASSLQYVIEVVCTAPLAVRFSFSQPDGAQEPALVPRLIRPAGYFVEATLRSLGGEEIFRTTRPKAKAKLDPGSADSYVELSPGYSYGAVLELGADPLPTGDYVLRVEYSNLDFTGPSSSPVGQLHHCEELDLSVP